MSLSERKKRILKAIIDEYIENAEPVGSKAIAARTELSLSPATIRNEMSDLEELGYLEQPHISAGRIPSTAGYRLYVDELMNRYKLSINELDALNAGLRLRMQELDRLIRDAGRAVSQLTDYPTYAIMSSVSEISIRKFDLIYVDSHTVILVLVTNSAQVKNKYLRSALPASEEEIEALAKLMNRTFTNLTLDKISLSLIKKAEIEAGQMSSYVEPIMNFAAEVMSEGVSGDMFVGGASKILSHPEYRDPDKARRILDYLSSDRREIVNSIAMDGGEDSASAMHISIGNENSAEQLKDASVVYRTYGVGKHLRGVIGVVGPTRMDYARVAANLNYFVEGLNKLLRESFLDDGN